MGSADLSGYELKIAMLEDDLEKANEKIKRLSLEVWAFRKFQEFDFSFQKLLLQHYGKGRLFQGVKNVAHMEGLIHRLFGATSAPRSEV